MKNKITQSILIALLGSMWLFFGCSPSLNVKVSSPEAVSIEFSSGLGENLVQTLYSITEADSQSPLFNKNAVAENLELSGFPVDSVSVDNNDLFVKTKPTSLKKIATNSSGFVEEVTSNSVTISLTPEKFQEFASILPEETVGYLDLLCAPIFTNEELTTEDYYEVLSAIYGNKLAKEAMFSTFIIEVSVPETSSIKKIDVKVPSSKTVTNKNKARITIPLADFLCNLEESSIIIAW